MSLENIRRRLNQAEYKAGIGRSGLGRLPAVWIATRSDEDRAQQLAALTAAGEYQPDRLLIEWRVVKPEDMDRELHRPSSSPRSH